MTLDSSDTGHSVDQERHTNMNNFYLYLPGGMYRELSSVPEMAKIISAIDALLADEFSHLDVQRIYNKKVEAGLELANAVNSGQFRTRVALEAVVGEKVREGNAGVEELRPMFNRLVEMGFDPVLLAQ